MESTFLNIKLLIFLALMASVVLAVGAVLVAGIYQLIRDQVRKSRRSVPTAPQEGTSHS